MNEISEHLTAVRTWTKSCHSPTHQNLLLKVLKLDSEERTEKVGAGEQPSGVWMAATGENSYVCSIRRKRKP